MTAMAVPPNPGVLPNGSISASVAIFDPAVNKKLVRCYCFAYAAPRVDWGDKSAYELMAQDVAGTGGQPNRYVLDHTYAVIASGSFSITVMGAAGQANQVLQISVGDLRVFDPHLRRLTVAERWALELEQKAAIDQVSPEIGSDPGNSAAPGGTVVAPASKQADA